MANISMENRITAVILAKRFSCQNYIRLTFEAVMNGQHYRAKCEWMHNKYNKLSRYRTKPHRCSIKTILHKHRAHNAITSQMVFSSFKRVMEMKIRWGGGLNGGCVGGERGCDGWMRTLSYASELCCKLRIEGSNKRQS